jgi:hypothetical protein
MPGELRPHSLIPSSLDLIINNLQANALRDAEALVQMLAEHDVPERLSIRHPDHYQAVAIQQHVFPLLKFVQGNDITNALAVARAAIVSLDEAEKTRANANLTAL